MTEQTQTGSPQTAKKPGIPDVNSRSTLPKRSEVSASQTWDLNKLFLDFAAWEKAFEAFPTDEEIEKNLAAKFKCKLASSPQVIAEALTYRNELSQKIENLFVYAGLRNAEDVGESTSSGASARASSRYAGIMAKFAFLSPELLTVSELESWIATHALAPFAYELSELLRGKKHVLSEKEEALLARVSTPLSKFSEIHSKWNNVDLKFPPAKDSKGENHLVSLGRFSGLLTSTDRTLRKGAFESLYGEIAKSRNTIASNFTAKLLAGSTVAKIRNYDGFRHSQLDPDNIPVDVYDNLVASVRSNLPLLHRSMEMRRKILKLDKVELYDRYASLSDTGEPTKLSFEEARDLVLGSLEPLGKDYVEAAKKGLTSERWIDFAENEGKRSGAFSWGTYSSNPVMHMTWTGSLNDMFTLAHELGHSMHSYLSNRAQPYQTAHYTIFVAEVASTLNEALLCDYILAKKPGTKLALEVMSHWLQSFEATVLRQTLFATFERDVAARIDADDPLTADALDAIYLDLNREWYGPSCEYPVALGHEWMRIPHFYNTFYVYKYATSFCASLALAEQIKLNPEKTRAHIFGLLESGGSKAPLEIMKTAGVDFLTPAPVADAFQAYARYLDLAEKTFGK